PSGKYLLVSGIAPIQLWDIRTGNLHTQLGASLTPAGSNDTVDVYFSQDGTMLALVVIPFGHNGIVSIQDVASAKVLDLFTTDYGSNIYFGNATVLAIPNYGPTSTTYLRGDALPKDFHDVTNPIINPSTTLIAFSNYADNSIVLYGIP